jgi:hypothetical protein
MSSDRSEPWGRSLLRFALLIGLAGSVVVGVWAVRYLVSGSAKIHGYFDLDNERGMSTWTFHFGAIQATAAALGAVLIATMVFTILTRRQRRWGIGFGAAVTLAVIGLSVLVAFGAAHSRAIHGGEDPSWWMNVCAAALAGEVAIALLLGASLVLPGRRAIES